MNIGRRRKATFLYNKENTKENEVQFMLIHKGFKFSVYLNQENQFFGVTSGTCEFTTLKK